MLNIRIFCLFYLFLLFISIVHCEKEKEKLAIETYGELNAENSNSTVTNRNKRSYKFQNHHKPSHPKKCHPQTVTKFKTIYKERKADIHNQVEILIPQPRIKKITETRYTTIRYPVFITQVIKPILTQVETKVKPVFFTKTINKYTTVLFTVTGIGQVTITKMKYEKEYITRCLKKGYHHHRSDSYGNGREALSQFDVIPHRKQYEVTGSDIPPPPGLPYDEKFAESKRVIDVNRETPEAPERKRKIKRRKRPTQQSEKVLESRFGETHNRRYKRPHTPVLPPRTPLEYIIGPLSKSKHSRRQGELNRFSGQIGNVQDLYNTNMYYQTDKNRQGRQLFPTLVEDANNNALPLQAHPPLRETPREILVW